MEEVYQVAFTDQQNKAKDTKSDRQRRLCGAVPGWRLFLLSSKPARQNSAPAKQILQRRESS